MKLRILFLTALLFAITYGCNKVNDLSTSDNNQNETSLKFSGTHYWGTTVPNFAVEPTIDTVIVLPNDNVKILGYCSAWIENVEDDDGHLALLSGESVYCENLTYNIWKPEIHFWGTSEIVPEEGGGVWKGKFNGFGYFTGEPPYNFLGGSPVVVEGIEIRLTGHGGDIQGMVAKADYSINTGIELVYYIDGKYK
jgi:hypothetical protein